MNNIAAIVIVLLIDILFVFNISYNFFPLQKFIRPSGVALSYICLAIALYLSVDIKSISKAILLGIVIYGIYDFTNFGTIEAYNSIPFIILDICWGGTIFGIYHSLIN